MEPEKLDFFETLAEALRPVIAQEIRASVSEAMKVYNKTEPEDIIKLDEAVKFLGLTRNTIYAKVSKDEIPHIKRGGRLYFSRKKLREYLEFGT